MSIVVALLAALAVSVLFRPRPRPARVGVRDVSPGPGETFAGHIPPAAAADWAAELSRELRAGASLRSAVTETVPADPHLAAATAGLRRRLGGGDPLSVALADLAARGRHVELVGHLLAACTHVGGAAAEPLDRAAAVLRGRAADQEDRVAQSAQARLSAQVMTVIPLFSLALLAVTDAGVRQVVASPIGWVCLALGLLCNGAGWLAMRRIVGSHRWAR